MLHIVVGSWDTCITLYKREPTHQIFNNELFVFDIQRSICAVAATATAAAVLLPLMLSVEQCRWRTAMHSLSVSDHRQQIPNGEAHIDREKDSKKHPKKSKTYTDRAGFQCQCKNAHFFSMCIFNVFVTLLCFYASHCERGLCANLSVLLSMDRCIVYGAFSFIVCVIITM